ncbi:MAG: DUF433 domain-containing protein [Gemmataceae bacterium]
MIKKRESVRRIANPAISKTAKVVGGEARIRNTRIPVWSLVQLRNFKLKDEEIMSYFSSPLTKSDLKAAWAYYEEHREEIDEAIAQNDAD